MDKRARSGGILCVPVLAMVALSLSILMLVMSLLAGGVSAADYYITPSHSTVDGDNFCGGSKCDSNDRIIIRGGVRGNLILQDFNGVTDYITITNENSNPDSRVIIDANSGLGAAVFTIDNCKYVDIRGDGDSDIQYGIKVYNDGGEEAGHAMRVIGRSSHVKVGYIEMDLDDNKWTGGDNPNMAMGLQIRDTTGLDSSWTYDTFEIHNNYIHGTRYCALYLGYNFPRTENTPYIANFLVYNNIIEDCGSYGITLKGVNGGPNRIYNNIIDTTGFIGYWYDHADDWNHGIGVQAYYDGSYVEIFDNTVRNTVGPGLKIGSGEHLIYDNEIINCGTGGESAWGHGIIVYMNSGQGLNIFNNKIIDSEIHGIYGNSNMPSLTIYQNVITNSGNDGININAPTTGVSVKYNTITGSADDGIYTSATNGLIQDNLIADSGGSAIDANDGITVSNSHVYKNTVSECNFESPGYPSYNYDLTSSTPSDIIDSGQSSGYPSLDFEGRTRPFNGVVDIGAYEYAGITSQYTCSELAGQNWDCCTNSETCPGTIFSGATDCPGRCCSETCETPQEEIVGHWTMDSSDISGGIVSDQSGKANHCVIQGNPATALGKVNEALSFDGDGDYLDCGNDASLDITGDITMAMWVNAREIASTPDLLTKGRWDQLYSTWISDSGRFGFGIDNNKFYSSSDIQTNTWYHLVTVREGSSVRVYVDGQLNTSSTYADLISTGSQPLTISTSDFSFDGAVDDVWLYNYALDNSEVLSLYRMGQGESNPDACTDLGGDGCCTALETCSGTIITGATDCPDRCCQGTCEPVVVTEGIVGRWTMDSQDISGGVVADVSGSGNDCTINGPTSSQGMVGESLSFEGSGDYLDCGSGTSMDNLREFTWSAWIYPTGWGTAGYGRIIVKNNPSDYEKSLYLSSPSDQQSIEANFDNTLGTDTTSIAANNAIILNQWQHVVARFSEDDRKLHLYVNGEEAGYARQDTQTGTPFDDSPYSLIIGNRDDKSRPFQGRIDEVMIYNTSLSDSEILGLYDSSFHNADSTKDGCIEEDELIPFIDLWKYDSTAYPMGEMMEAVVLYYSPGTWC